MKKITLVAMVAALVAVSTPVPAEAWVARVIWQMLKPTTMGDSSIDPSPIEHFEKHAIFVGV